MPRKKTETTDADTGSNKPEVVVADTGSNKPETAGEKKYNNVRRWTVPSKRAKGYAEERKQRVRVHGPNKGDQLDDYELGLRSGYLLCQSDHAGTFIYKTALSEGKSKEEAIKLSRTKGKFQKKKEEK